MLEYNKDKNILYAYQNELARPKLIPDNKPNVVYDSYQKFLNDRVKDDVMDVFMPALVNAIDKKRELISTRPERVVVKHVDPGKFEDYTQHVTVKFILPKFDESKAQDVTIVKVPSVDERGIIEYEGQHYSFIHMLEQQATISYEANATTAKPASLKVKNGNRSLWIDDSNSELKIRMSDRNNKTSKTKYSLIKLTMAMARYEEYDTEELFNEFANFFIVNMFKDEDSKEQVLHGLFGNEASVSGIEYDEELVPRLTLTRINKNTGVGDDSYDNSVIRGELNELLSLDRAIGEALAFDVMSVINPTKKLASAGEIVDSNMLQVFNTEGVYKVYIKYIPDIEGYYLIDDIVVNYAPQGLRITDELRPYFPEEKGMYTSKFYDKLPVPIIYESGTALTRNMINVIVAFGVDSIKVSDKATGGRIKTLNFYEEVISNRQFLGSSIGKDAETWYYLNKDLEFVKATGTYTTYDFMALYSFCVKLFEGKYIDRIVNADAGFRKVLVPIEEQYHRAFCYAVREGFKQMNRKFKETYKSDPIKFLIRDYIDNDFYPFTKKFWEYLRDEAKCIVRLQEDNIHNPVAYQSACTKVNVYTANKHSVADSQREIAIGSYAKIDPYEIPQSGKMGTVYNSCCDTVIDVEGNMRTLYYRMKPLGSKSKIMTNELIGLTSKEEEQYVIADICSFEFDANGVVQDNTKIVQCRVPTRNSIEKSTFAYRPISQVDFVNINATQPLSWASSTIPYMSCNDAARAIFAVAQEKQAKGLIETEEPDVITSAYEQFPWLNDKYGIIAKEDGVVVSLEYLWKEEKYHLAVRYASQAIDDGTIYQFDEYFYSKYSVTKLKVLVKKGDTFKKGQMLVCSNFISENGILMLGRNALVGYHCDGYNYEDGAHISEAMCDKLASYRINKEEFAGNPESTRSYRVRNMDNTRYISPEDKSILSVAYTDKRYLESKKRDMPIQHAYGFIEGYESLVEEKRRGNYGIALKTVSIDRFGKGDKNSNRHGNKGVLSRIEPTGNMPRLNNGMALDMTFNPLGVGSRMNIGQVRECHTGLIAHVNKFKLSADAYNGISEEEIHMLMSLTVDLMNSTGDIDGVLAQHSDLLSSNHMKNVTDFIAHIRENIDAIRVYANCFNKKGTTKIHLVDNDGRLTETEVLVGYIHVYKLIQEAHKKIHARGGQNIFEPYGTLTDAPTHGSANGGGQRFGTMEIDGLCAYAANNYIHELTNERCDNAIARDNFNIDTFFPPKLAKEYRIDSKGQRRAVTQFLYTMLALGTMMEPNDNEFLPLSNKNGEELAHWKPSVIQQAKLVSTKSDDAEKSGNGPTFSATSEESTSGESKKISAKDLILGKFV